MADQPFGRVRLVEMVVESVRVHMLSSQHVVILKESERDRYLPIWIGQSEANAIAMRLQGVSAERPLTHDLIVSMLGSLASSVSRVVVTHVTEGTFHARVYLETYQPAAAKRLTLGDREGARLSLVLPAMTPRFHARHALGITAGPGLYLIVSTRDQMRFR